MASAISHHWERKVEVYLLPFKSGNSGVTLCGATGEEGSGTNAAVVGVFQCLFPLIAAASSPKYSRPRKGVWLAGTGKLALQIIARAL